MACRYLRGRLNANLGGMSLSADDACLHPDDSKLRCIDLRMSAHGLCAPLILPKLLRLTLSLIGQPWKLKLSTDGTYRLLLNQYALLTFGVNLRNYSMRKSLKLQLLRSSFMPLAFAITNVEDALAYAHFLQTVVRAAKTLSLALDASHILQFHIPTMELRTQGSQSSFRALDLQTGLT